MKGKAEFNHQKSFFFRRKLYFFKSEPKKGGADVCWRPPPHSTHAWGWKLCKFGDFIDVDPDPDTIDPDPHHWVWQYWERIRKTDLKYEHIIFAY